MKPTVVVYGAAGHTGLFVVAELQRRGFVPVLAGRDAAKLDVAAEVLAQRGVPALEQRVASVDDAAGLDRVLDGAAAVVNAAGPFADTSVPVVEAALRAGVHYLDVAAEQPAVLSLFERFAGADVVVLPAMAFYGGLPDLLATLAMGDWDRADEVAIGVALDTWHPTAGTRRTGERNPGQRLRFTHGQLVPSDPPGRSTWTFPEPFGQQDVAGLLLAESILIPRHLQVAEVVPYINTTPLDDVRDPDTPPPAPADDSGRSAQVFLVEVVVRRAGEERRAAAGGRDIYAVTAPLVVEAVERIVDGRTSGTGVVTAGEAFDAADFLDSLRQNDPTNWFTA